MANIELQIATETNTQLPSEEQLLQWVELGIQTDDKEDTEICVRVVESDEIQELNKQYRGKDKPTNVLSFPADLPEGVDLPLLGDLIICADVVSEEAQEQGKALFDHWAHMLIHGTLHLQGYDHIDESDAGIMENLEISLLASINIENPYE